MKPPIPKWFPPAQGVAPRRHIPIIHIRGLKPTATFIGRSATAKMPVFPWNHANRQFWLAFMPATPLQPPKQRPRTGSAAVRGAMILEGCEQSKSTDDRGWTVVGLEIVGFNRHSGRGLVRLVIWNVTK